MAGVGCTEKRAQMQYACEPVFSGTAREVVQRQEQEETVPSYPWGKKDTRKK